jgi:hypothetical protein
VQAMTLSYNDIFALVNTIDDCTVVAEEGACQVAILSGSDRTLCFSRQLYCGELKVTVDDEGTGVCEYIAYTRSYIHGTQTIPATQFRTDREKTDSRDSRLRSTIGEIVKIDVANIRKFAVAAY